jgi:hypothetical protein
VRTARLFRAKTPALVDRDQVLGDQFGGEARDGVGVGEHRQRVVLRLVAFATHVSRYDERSFARHAPVGRSLEAHLAVEHAALRVADLVCRGLSNGKVRVERRRILGDVRVEDGFLVHASGLALVERDDGRDRGIARAAHAFRIQLGVIVAEHVEIQGCRDMRQEVLQDAVDVVPAHVEQVEVLASVGRVKPLLRELLQFRQRERLQAGSFFVHRLTSSSPKLRAAEQEYHS